MWEGEGLFRVVHPRCETEGPHASAHTVFICFFFITSPRSALDTEIVTKSAGLRTEIQLFSWNSS